MELQYIVLTIIKILISVPTLVVVIQLQETDAAALIGGHVNNGNIPPKTNISEFKIDLSEDNVQDEPASTETDLNSNQTNEAVPDPEPLVVPGYNLPENIFNKGKPFYLEKDPLTGSIDFNTKGKLYEEYEYDDVEYDRESIDRKDGPANSGSHKPSDINQLTPNFHDFLNLPVKYNPDKYVYPLISSSYANTKVQGNVNKHQNHKNYVVTTYKPTFSPTYYTTKYYHTQDKIIEFTTPKKSYYEDLEFTTSKPAVKVQSTKRVENLMHSPMNHPSYKEEYYNKKPTTVPTTTRLMTTTSRFGSLPTASTKRPMSLFEQLFGSDYDEGEATEGPTTTTSTTTMGSTAIPAKTVKPYQVSQQNLNNQQGGQQIQLFHNLPKKATTPTGYASGHSSTAYQNVLTGSNMADMNMNYDYEEEKPAQVSEVSKQPAQVQNVTPSVVHLEVAVDNNGHPDMPEEYDYDYLDKTTMTSTTIARSTTPSTTVAVSTTTSTPSTYYSSLGTSSMGPSSILTTTEISKMTSLPLGENHIHHNHQQHVSHPIIVATQNLREQLNGEKVGFVHPQAPSTSSIHIAPDQDTVSFVMGNHQNVEGAAGTPGGYVGTSLKESPYESNPFRPVYDQQAEEFQIKSEYQRPFLNKIPTQHNTGGSTVTIQPIKNSEASLSIGSQIALKPGHVVDEKIEEVDYTKGSKIVFPDSVDKSTTYSPDLSPPPPPPPMGIIPQGILPPNLPPGVHKEVLKLSSKPMFHQLPSELTPPDQSGAKQPPARVRPPWDPRPGHFHAGRPEYARPPRPQEVYKRVDSLPNILPQFRPNMSNKPIYHHSHPPHGQHPHYDRNQHQHPHSHQHQHQPNQHQHMPPSHHGQHSNNNNNNNYNNYARQPLLERPSNNRPIAFFEKLHPPPPPTMTQSKIPSKVAEDRIGPKPLQQQEPHHQQQQQQLNHHQQQQQQQMQQQHQHIQQHHQQQQLQQQQYQQHNQQPPQSHIPPMQEHFAYLQAPPKVMVSNRRSGEDPETLQMIQAKQDKKTEKPSFKQKSDIKDNIIKDTMKEHVVTPKSPSYVNTDKPLYVVYPVNSPPIKLDALDTNKKEAVVIGTRAELPLPPSKIKQSSANPTSIATESDFKYEVKDRHDSPILKPRPATFPIKSDFPYPLERPDPSILPSSDIENKLPDEPTIISSNQWNTIEDTEPRIVHHNINANSQGSNNQISVTLKTYTEKPIAVAYTPTESSKFSIPNYASLVIPEIRDSEITVSAVMHHAQPSQPVVHHRPQVVIKPQINEEVIAPRPQQEFQAPFQASAHVDHSISQGWAVVREKDERKDEITTPPLLATTGEFDIENFKPQLEGGFKPIYSYPDETQDGKDADKETVINERQE